MPQRRRGKGPGGGQFLPGPRAHDRDTDDVLTVNEYHREREQEIRLANDPDAKLTPLGRRTLLNPSAYGRGGYHEWRQRRQMEREMLANLPRLGDTLPELPADTKMMLAQENTPQPTPLKDRLTHFNLDSSVDDAKGGGDEEPW